MVPTTQHASSEAQPETHGRSRTISEPPRSRGSARGRGVFGRSGRTPYVPSYPPSYPISPPSTTPSSLPVAGVISPHAADPVSPGAEPRTSPDPTLVTAALRGLIRRGPEVVAAVAGALSLGGLAGAVLGGAQGSVLPLPVVALDIALTVGFLPGGLVLTRRRPGDPRAWLLAATGLLALFGLASAAWSGGIVGAWLAQWAWWPPLAMLPVLLACLPGVPTRSPRRRWLDLSAIAGAVGTGCLMMAAAAYPRLPIETVRATIGGVDWVWLIGWAGSAAICALATIAAVAVLIRRGTRDRGIARRGPAALIPPLVAAPVGAVLAALGVPGAALAPLTVLGLSLSALVLPDPQGAQDRHWRRVLVAACSGAGVFVVLVAGWLGLWPLVRERAWLLGLIAVLAAATVGAYGVRWHAAVERVITRVLDGPAHDPFRALRDPEPPEVPGGGPAEPPRIAGLVEAVAAALRLRGARIRAVVGADLVVVAQSGRCDGEPLSFPIGTPDGSGRVAALLEVTPVRADTPLSHEHLAVLRRAARLAARAVDAERPEWEAGRARAAVVARREEERRRLREALHGALWPAVSGCRVELESARRRIPDRAVRAGGGAATIAGVLDGAIDDLVRVGVTIQDLMDGLRPDGLDQGLEWGVRDAVERLLPGANVEVDVRGELANLPDEVEVAAYRIVCEALGWVARRPDVRHVRLRVGAAQGSPLELVVVDDGLGSIAPSPAPVGVSDPSAMWTWAQEVGGRVSVLSSNTGTRVGAILPYAATAQG